MKKEENRVARERLSVIMLEMKNIYSELLYPLSVLKLEEAPPGIRLEGIATDGLKLYYNPEVILHQRREMIMMQIMHIMLHGMLGHFAMKDDYEQKTIRDIMMDLQADYLLARIGGDAAKERGYTHRRLEELVQGDYSLAGYYRLLENRDCHSELKHYQYGLTVDDHAMWERDMSREHQQKVQQLWGKIQQAVLGEAGEEIGDLFAAAGRVMGTLRCSQEEGYDVGKGSGKNYREVLSEVFRPREICREEPDSIDNMFYSYGLELYGDVPLIEPLEITERPALQMLVIAVDVSGSCASNRVMEKFWGETYDCISQLRTTQTEGEILLLQCDCGVQDEQRVNLADFAEIPKEISVKGHGGTSFVPVFERIKELEAEGMIVDALIYLTDGEGTYPEEKPHYPVYFVMEKESFAEWYVEQYMPEWVNKINLE